MGSQPTKIRNPDEKHAFSIGIREYQDSDARYQYRSLTNPAQNAYQMAKFFKKHEYNVTSNIKDYEDVKQKRAKSKFQEDI